MFSVPACQHDLSSIPRTYIDRRILRTHWSNQNHLQVIDRFYLKKKKVRVIEEDSKHWPLAHTDTHAPAQTWAHTQHKTNRNFDITVLSCQKSEDTRKTDRTLVLPISVIPFCPKVSWSLHPCIYQYEKSTKRFR